MGFIIACVASFIPYTILFLWLRSLQKGDQAYRSLCDRNKPDLLQAGLCVICGRDRSAAEGANS